ncbi:hypothetical protein V6N12_052054 [Hibiscus sabdariffa]|uniref:Uncharacterized protein n=1 Tax=Hibiscus sabdariffa TaxID=183260 RepID=A0ABR2GHR0_9ROSI
MSWPESQKCRPRFLVFFLPKLPGKSLAVSFISFLPRSSRVFRHASCGGNWMDTGGRRSFQEDFLPVADP